MTNYGRVNYGGLFVRPLSTYVVSATHTHRREMHKQTQTHTHSGTHAHAQVGHTHVAFVCVAKKAIKIFSLQILFCFISPFLFVSSSRCVCVSMCVCVGGRKDGTKVDIGLFAYASHTRTLHSALHSLCQGKNLFYMYLYACLPLILVDSTRLYSTRLGVVSFWPEEDAGQVAAAGCCRWLLPALRFVFKSRSAVAEITFCLLPLLKQ